MIDFEKKSSYGVEDLREIVRILRAPGGCPWDREQDHHSIRRNLLEEAYEAAEAIDEGNPEHLQEELGDVLLQVVFHARMEEEQGGFDLDDVADGICKKLIYRHPHVFGDVTVSGSGEVLQNWEELKKREKHQTTAADSVDSVARSLPGLWRAEKIQKKAAKVAGRLGRAGKAARGGGRAGGGCPGGHQRGGRAGRSAVRRRQCGPIRKGGPGGRPERRLRQVRAAVPPGGGIGRRPGEDSG